MIAWAVVILKRGRSILQREGVYMRVKLLGLASVFLVTVALQACKHTLAIVGEGDIVDANNSGRGCTLEQFQAGNTACTENKVNGDYFVNYKAEPRPGWRFLRWQGPCSPDSDFQHCGFEVSKDAVDWWDETYPDNAIPPSTAVFQPIIGETGYLLAGTAVAGVAYETSTQQGVTGINGSFQYEEGEVVRFTIGGTLLGAVTGQAQVTPFDLAGSPVHTGIHITWALQNENDPYQTVINLGVLLHSLDDDGNPGNGIVIRPGIASLLTGIALNLRKPWDRGEAGLRPFEQPFEPWLTFKTDPTFRHVLGRARRQLRFSTPHGMAEPSATLASVYDDLAIDPKVVGLSLLQVSQPGEPDLFENLYYDTNGNFRRHENTAYGDAYEIWQYDDRGKVTMHELNASSYPGGGREIETWQYDAMGSLTRHETSERIDIRAYVYDGDGNPVQESWTVNETKNINVVNFIYQYDKRGRLQQFTSTESEGFKVWRFNAQGKVLHYEDHFGYTEIWTYDSSGKLIRNGTWFDGSPQGGSPTILQYNADGNLIRSEDQSTWCDRGCYRFATTWDYDESGRLVIRSTVNLVDNYVLEVDTWQYNESGRVISREGDPFAGDERITETWQYYPNGQIMRHAIEGGYDQLDDQYDSRGNLTREVVFGYDGNSTEAWSYDGDNKLVYRGWDENRDGILEEMITYEYTATGWAHLFSGIEVYGQPYRPPTKPETAHEEKPPNSSCMYESGFFETNNC
jgi:YD repeat-containing protein